MEYIPDNQKGVVTIMKNIISCGRRNTVPHSNGSHRIDRPLNPVAHTASPRDKREKAASALLLFGAVICTLWLCHFPDRRAVGTDDDRGASALSEYEVIEVFGEFGADASPVFDRTSPHDDGWTLSGYFKEFFSALLGI